MISRATESDFDSIFRLQKECLVEEFWNENMLKEDFDKSNYLVYKQDDRVVAYISFRILFDEAELFQICVTESFKRHGIGSKLLGKMIEYCEENDVNRIFLEVREDNESAIALYKKFGFKHLTIRRNYYHNKTALLMERLISR